MLEWGGENARMRECANGERKYQLQSAVAVGSGEWGSARMRECGNGVERMRECSNAGMREWREGSVLMR